MDYKEVAALFDELLSNQPTDEPAEDELTHWGIKGMRWGVRRYQNPDGTLTPAGRKRYDKEMSRLKAEEKVLKNRKATAAKLQKLNDKKKANEDLKKELDGEKPSKKSKFSLKKSSDKGESKSLKDMSNDELRQLKERAQLERDYLDLQRQISNLTPKQISKGQKFLENLGKTSKEVLTPMVKKAGDKLVDDILKKAGIGANEKKTYKKVAEELKDEYNAKKFRSMIDELDKQTANAKQAAKDTKKAEKQAAKEDKKAEKQAAKEAKKAERQAAREEEPEIVFGPDKSDRGGSNPFDRKDDREPIDAVFYDMTVDDVSTSTAVSTGRRFIAGFLEEPKD